MNFTRGSAAADAGKPALPLNPSLLMQTAPFRGTPLPHCSSGRLRYSISFGNLIAAPTRRVTAPTLMWISSTYNLPYVGFSCAKPLNPSSLRYIGHSEESPLVELPAAVAVAAGFVYSGCGAGTHLLVNTISREIHLEHAYPLQVPVGHYPVPGGGKLPSPGTATPILHPCRAYPRSR